MSDRNASDPAADIERLDADTALKQAQARNLQADTALKTAQLAYQRANVEVDTLLKQTQLRWGPWKVVTTAMAAGGALVGGTVAAIASLLHAVVH